MKKNQSGFAVLETIVILIILIGVAGVAWSVGKNSKPGGNISTENAVGISSKQSIAPAGWKTFIDQKDKLSFDYPAAWRVDIKKTGIHTDNGAETLDGSVKSPSGKVNIVYQDFVAGIGYPGCNLPGDRSASYDPDLMDCPDVHILTSQNLPNIKNTNMKYIEKITHWKDKTEYYIPAFGLAISSSDYPLNQGTIRGQSDFFMRTNFTNDGGIFAQTWYISGDPKDGFSTEAAAEAYLNSSDVKTAKQIILSVRKN